MAQLRQLTRFLLFGGRGDTLPTAATKLAAARKRGMQLLMQNLTSEQIAEFGKHRHFVVRGGATGRRDRIRHGTQLNVEVIDDRGKAQAKLCFAPAGHLVEGDVMLAQKLALELFETEAVQLANWGHPDRPGPVFAMM